MTTRDETDPVETILQEIRERMRAARPAQMQRLLNDIKKSAPPRPTHYVNPETLH